MDDEKAILIDWPVPWDVGAPTPALLSGNGRLFLIYFARDVLSADDKTSVKIVGDLNPQNIITLVEFLGWNDFKFGGPDEDTIKSPYYIKGVEPYNAYIVENSHWLANLIKVYSSQRKFESTSWNKYKHYVLGFHDERFECIAKSFYIEVYNLSYDEVCEIAFYRITGSDWWMRGSQSEFRCPFCQQYLGKHLYAKFCMNCGKPLKNSTI